MRLESHGTPFHSAVQLALVGEMETCERRVVDVKMLMHGFSGISGVNRGLCVLTSVN